MPGCCGSGAGPIRSFSRCWRKRGCSSRTIEPARGRRSLHSPGDPVTTGSIRRSASATRSTRTYLPRRRGRPSTPPRGIGSRTWVADST
jgi:hypothetical protein